MILESRKSNSMVLASVWRLIWVSFLFVAIITWQRISHGKTEQESMREFTFITKPLPKNPFIYSWGQSSLLSWPNHLPKDSPPNTTIIWIWGIHFQHPHDHSSILSLLKDPEVWSWHSLLVTYANSLPKNCSFYPAEASPLTLKACRWVMATCFPATWCCHIEVSQHGELIG